jgi:hypothetical protein
MNPEREIPAPDDHEFGLPVPLGRVEEQLKRQPLPPLALDAEAILRAALGESGERGSDPANRVAQPDRAVSRYWIVLAASWMGGALAGSLVTALLLSRPAGANTVSEPDGRTAPQVSVEQYEPSSGRDSDRARRDEHRESDRDLTPWSQSEFLVSNRILNLGRPTPGTPPLQAGSYVQLSATAGNWVTRPQFGRPTEPGEPAFPDAATEVPPPATPEMTREDLLRELLGSEPESMF